MAAEGKRTKPRLNSPVAAIATALCAILLLGPAAHAESVLHRGLGGEPDQLDPHKSTLAVENIILADMMEGLVKIGPTGETVPALAARWETSPDGKTWTFYLRNNARWFDGSPVTAEDFVRGARRLFAPETASSGYIFLLTIENAMAVASGKAPAESLGVSAPDRQTVIIRLSQPDPLILLIMRSTILVPWHEGSGTGLDLIGNGPYRLVSWVPQSDLVLEPNPYYYDAAKVGYDRIVYYPTPDLQAGVKRYRAGELDILPTIPVNQFEALKSRFGDELQSGRRYFSSYIGINLDAKPFDDRRIRMAMLLAMDRDVLTDKVLRSEQVPSWRYTPDLIGDYPVAVSPFAGAGKETRLAEARRLMAEAGYGPGSTLETELRYIGVDQGKMVALAVRAMLQRIDVEVTLLSTDLKTHYNDLILGKYELATVGWNGNPNPDSFLKSFEYAGGANTFNISGYNSPAFDALLAEARDIVEPAARQAVFAKAESMLLDEAVMIPLYSGVSHALAKPGVKNFHVFPTGQTASEYLFPAD